jgi:hypothetical protein
MPDFLQEEPGRFVFVGDVMDVSFEQNGRRIPRYEVANGGWNWMGPDAPETLLGEQLLARFDDRRVRVTVEDLGPAEDHWILQREAYYRDHALLYINRGVLPTAPKRVPRLPDAIRTRVYRLLHPRWKEYI